jgi:hypothetical protein
MLCWIVFLFNEFQSNPENTVGVLTMAGKGVRVLATPTSDLGKILACMHGMFFFSWIFVSPFDTCLFYAILGECGDGAACWEIDTFSV